MVDAARQHDVTLVTCVGKIINWAYNFEKQANVLYTLINGERLDGLIIWKAGVVMKLTEPEIEAFCQQYNVPVVTVEGMVRGYPSVVYGNYQGMRAAIDHLIEVHGYRRIGFMGLHEHHVGFRERYRAYTDALAAHGLPVEPAWVKPAWSDRDILAGGRENEQALTTWLRGALSAGMEALAGVCDTVTIRVLNTLQMMGIRVPDEVALVSFDDFAEGRVITPPLTTVKPSWYALGQVAVETLLGILAGRSVPEQIVVPSQLVIRQSCGCLDIAVEAAGAEPLEQPALLPSWKMALDQVIPEMLKAARANAVEGVQQEVGKLAASFTAQITNQGTGTFLRTLDRLLNRVKAVEGDIPAWQNALSVMRRSMLPYLDDGKIAARADSLWQQARVMIGETAERAQAYRRFQAEQRTEQLRAVGQALITTFDVNELMNVLYEELPALGIPGCSLSLYENPQPYAYPDPAPEWSRLILAYNAQGRIELEEEGRRFLSQQLIPEGVWPHDRACSLVIIPLYFQDDQIGFVLFEAGSREGAIYATLRGEISSALQGALLVRRLQERSAELARQQYVLNTFMENVPDYIYFKDLESRFTRANRAHARKFGLNDPSEEIGKTDFDFFIEEQARIRYEQEQEIIRTGQPLLNLEEHDGYGQWALTTKMPLRDEKGHIIGTFGISRNITQLKQAQTALERAYAGVEQQIAERTAELKLEIAEREQAQAEREALIAELETKNAELERFTYTVSHDLKSPLITIGGFVGFLEKDALAGDQEQINVDIAHINDAVARMQRLLDELLELSRIGRQMNPPGAISFADIVHEAIALARGRIAAHGVAVEIAPDFPVVYGDRARLVEVVQNLVDNACKFMGEQPQPRIEIGVRNGEAEPVFYVRDNGIGIEPQYHNKVFGLFEKLNPQSEGTGIGLALVKRIIETHGGKIWIESTGKDDGTTFYFTLPEHKTDDGA